MAIALSSADVARLAAAFTTLLSPLGCERLTDSRKASREAAHDIHDDVFRLQSEQTKPFGERGLTLLLLAAFDAGVRTVLQHDARWAGLTGALGSEAAILVLLDRITPEPWSDAALRARFRLTPREVAVARLLAERRGAREIARTLGISVHTARRHTEHVYDKLGLRSRGAVAEALRTVPEREPSGPAPARSRRPAHTTGSRRPPQDSARAGAARPAAIETLPPRRNGYRDAAPRANRAST